MVRILVVDDHDNLRFALSVMLESAGHSVITARNGEEALLELDSNVIDMLITDVEMPGMDGLALTVEVRHRFPRIFILVMSSDPERGILALDAGAHLFLAKPFARNNLIEAVGQFFGSTDGYWSS